MSPLDVAIHIEHCAHKTSRLQSIYINRYSYYWYFLLLKPCWKLWIHGNAYLKGKTIKRRWKEVRFAEKCLLIYWGHILWIASHIAGASYRVWSSADKDISRSFATKRKLPQKGGGGSKPVTSHMICWPTISYFIRLPPFLFLSPTAECMCHFGETYVQIAI